MCLILGIILSLLTVQILAECITPNNEKAECISLYSCPVLIGALAIQQADTIEFVRQSNCGGTAINPMVCCGSSVNFIKGKNDSDNSHSRNETQKIDLLPTRRFCGYQHSDDYFHTMNITTITEFPWLAKLVYKHENSNVFHSICTGSLINTRYVLTAAQCLVNDGYGGPVAVHLGEYHVRNKTDCVQEPPFDQECSESIQIVDIEKRIPHPKYSLSNKTYDIALLRLNKKISYSDYVRPVCLPLPGTTFAKVGDILTSSGWGLNSYSAGESFAEIKKKSLSTLIANEQCALEYPIKTITINHLCAIPVQNSTELECFGDSGGPLLFSHRNQWHQEGIVSFGKAFCKLSDASVYTKVVNYLDWILENIEK